MQVAGTVYACLHRTRHLWLPTITATAHPTADGGSLSRLPEWELAARNTTSRRSSAREPAPARYASRATRRPMTDTTYPGPRRTDSPKAVNVQMDHDEAPVLDALANYHRLGRYGFTPPGHRQGAGALPDDERTHAGPMLGGSRHTSFHWRHRHRARAARNVSRGTMPHDFAATTIRST